MRALKKTSSPWRREGEVSSADVVWLCRCGNNWNRYGGRIMNESNKCINYAKILRKIAAVNITGRSMRRALMSSITSLLNGYNSPQSIYR